MPRFYRVRCGFESCRGFILDKEFREFFEGADSDAPNSGFQFSQRGATPYVFGPDWDGPKELKSPFGFEWNPTFEERCRLLLSGLTTSEVIRQAGGNCVTSGGTRLRLRLLRKILVYSFGEIFCACGRQSDHMGHCKPRFEARPRSQAAWTETQRKGLLKIACLRKTA